MTVARRYFAIVDNHHDKKDPVTVVRVVEGVGPAGLAELNQDAFWSRTTLPERIEAGEVPYRAVEITAKAATRIRERREKKIAFRYSILVEDDDPTDRPVGVLREWDASGGGLVYAEVFGRENEWTPSSVRKDIERGSDIARRIVPSDAATVHRFISSLRGW